MQQTQKTKRHDKSGQVTERRKKEAVDDAERRERVGPQGDLLGCQRGKSNVVSLGQPYIIPRASRPPPISPLAVCFLFPLIDVLSPAAFPPTASDYATRISPAEDWAKPKSMGIHTAVVGAISSCSSLESLDRFLSARTPQWPPGC